MEVVRLLWILLGAVVAGLVGLAVGWVVYAILVERFNPVIPPHPEPWRYDE